MKVTRNRIWIITISSLILFMLSVYKCNAQDGISFSVLQDVKLGLGMDKKHMNPNPTLDIIVNMNWEGKQYDYYYFTVQTQYERANLHDGYFSRYSVHGIWNLNTLILPKLKLGFGVGIGMIHRPNTGGLGSYSGTLDVSYPIAKKLSVIAKNEWVRRPDLITPKLGYNLALGLNYKF
tara:strand:- start:7195 stop:7728 length:534 start_codon:yes stop_codon:yes gene_type:complete